MNTVNDERLIGAVRQQQERLKEILESIERRDITPSQIRETLDGVAESLRRLRKDARALSV